MELVVTTFARVVDWVGIRSLVLGQLDLGQRQEVERRIGAYNLFHEAAAVDHWTLELSRPEERRILQELIHLGEGLKQWSASQVLSLSMRQQLKRLHKHANEQLKVPFRAHSR